MKENDPEVVPVFSPQPTGTSSAAHCLHAVVALARRHRYDVGHRGLVRGVRCRIKQDCIICQCTLAGEATPVERLLLKQRALAKGSLLQGVFGCRLSIKWSA